MQIMLFCFITNIIGLNFQILFVNIDKYLFNL